jgi:erythromycin esterase
MKPQPKFQRTFLFLFCLALLLSACSPTPVLTKEEEQTYFQPVSALTLPDSVRLVGMGEATHGNAEFVRLRQEVFAQLVAQYGFRTFAIEGDFGGAQVVNHYILTGEGSAADAVRQIGFAIYRTQEMVDLVEWMRAYNQSAPADQQIHFYGFDMQRYDNNKNGLLTYLQQVDPQEVEPAAAALADLNDETVFNQSKEKVQAGLKAIQDLRAKMDREKEGYIAASSADAYALADQFAACIEQNATLRGTDVNYSQARDQYMAEKVSWIFDYEQRQGRNRLFLAGHNGHVEKSAAAPQYRSMGSRLNEQYGDRYFTIGAEFYESDFNSAETGSSQRKQFSVKNSSVLNRVFEHTGLTVAYLDIRRASENEILKPLLNSPQPMSNIGDEFSALYRYAAGFYTLKMTPAKAYDALIFVRHATPTTMIAAK